LYSLDIDIGGTFTDGFFTDGADVRTGKVLTTPHDVTEGFLECIRMGSRLFDLEPDEFLRRTDIARLSTTIGTNLLVQRKGARIGLIVTAGAEQTLYGPSISNALGDLIASDMVIGIPEEVDDDGRIVTAPRSDEVLAGVRGLIQNGAQLIVVSLKNAWRNPAHERAIRDIVRARYPIHYLRSVPVQLGVEVVHDHDDHARTNSALLNAYIHADMARVLFRAEDKLRDAGYNRPLLIVHASGGNARIAKTIALNTLHSGPAVAVKGAAVLADLLDLDHVVSADMGGTSFDIGLVMDKAVMRQQAPQIEHFRIATPTIEVGSVGLGGGSIVRVDGDNLKVGPESAGSAPGPVCYGKGGSEPTVTDANLVLGFIDPDYFLGGRMKLDLAAARQAIERRIARKLGISGEAAAFEIRRIAGDIMGNEIDKRLKLAGLNGEDVSLLSVGGAGPLHACDIVETAGLKQAIAFPFGSVFSAFGGNTTDVQHLYSHAFSAAPARLEDLAAALGELMLQARRDMKGEGFLAAAELEVSAESDTLNVMIKEPMSVDVSALAAALWGKAGKQPIETLRLTASSRTPHWTPPRQTVNAAAPERRGERAIWWEKDRATPTPVYARKMLVLGATIAGPAIVEGPDTTYAVRPGWRLSIDAFGSLTMTRNPRL
jgi:N-methylhydantoinase A/acetophenone carboxylase